MIKLHFVVLPFFLFFWLGQHVGSTLSYSEKEKYRNLVVEMFFHAFDSYMNYAYPADELMPLSCKGRVRGREPSRGDVDDSLGRFSLTLIDSLDTLAVIGAIDEFSIGLKRVINEVRFDANLTVSVFETNIRVLGGLLGAHFAADSLKKKGHPLLQWYDDQLVPIAKTVGDKLLPAFNTSTGIPYARINLRSGINDTTGNTTCTACGGTLLMEFAALSQLTGDPIYEAKAHQAMEAIWNLRHSVNHLVGTVVNVHSGKWTNKDSGVGAGIDSYYEYCLKAYVLLGKKDYLTRFNKHYSAIKRYVSNGPFLLGVNMNSPAKPSRHFMDSLLAFWPGLQVLWGDVDSAVSIYNLLYDIVIHYKFLPEAFSATDISYKVVWPQHPLRPEFIESTYFLYKATNDPFYLEVGKIVVHNLNQYARVRCGFASIKDVKHGSKEDRLDSFFLAETLKYLYLLFSEESDIPFDIDDFIFTTEAHLIPLAFSSKPLTKPRSSPPIPPPPTCKKGEEDVPLVCPIVRIPWAESNYYYRLCMKQCSGPRHLYPLNTILLPKIFRRRSKRLRFDLRKMDLSDPEQLRQLKEIGISVSTSGDGKVMMTHNPHLAESTTAALEGAQLIQDIIQLTNKFSAGNKRDIKLVRILHPKLQENFEFIAGPAQFGPDLGGESHYQVGGKLVFPKSPVDGCDMFGELEDIKGKIPLIVRGGCMFIHKVRNAQRSGAIGVIIYDNAGRSQNNDSKPPFPFSMSGDENMSDVLIPSLFITHSDGQRLLQLRKDGQSVNVLLTWLTPEDMKRHSVQSILGAGESSTSEKGKESEASKEDREENIWPPPPPPSSSSSLP